MKPKVVVIGTGYVGLPAALMWARAGVEVVGVDINENVVRAINERTLLIREQELQQLFNDPAVREHLKAQNTPCEGDVFVIAVPTPVDPLRKVADLSFVESAVASITPFLRRGNLVLIESTVPPLTCREIIAPKISQETGLEVPEEVMLAHCPERILPGDIFREIVLNDRLIGGLDAASTDAAIGVYKYFVRGNLLPTSDVVAELVKLMENSYRDVNIALANEFAQICGTLGVSPDEAIKLANRHPRVNILRPGIGVGGHCISVDPWFLKEVAPYCSQMITTARLINDGMPALIAGKIRKSIRHIPDPKIVAFGATYKKNCEDLRESPAIEIVRLLREDGYNVCHYDPLVPGMADYSIEEVLRTSDLVVILVAHDELLDQLSRAEAIDGSCNTGKMIQYFDC